MKTYLYTLIFLLFIPIGVQAQQLTAGPVMGFNYNSIYFNENFAVDNENFNFRTDDGGIGIMAGGFARVDHKKIFTEARLVFSQESSSAVLHSDQGSLVQDINFNRIYLPLTVGYAVDNKFDVFVGANISHFVDGSMIPSNNALYVQYDNATNPTSFGYFMGLGVKINRFNVNLNYSGNLGATSISTSFREQVLNFDQTDHNFNFTLSYELIFKNLKKQKEDIYFNPDELMVTD